MGKKKTIIIDFILLGIMIGFFIGVYKAIFLIIHNRYIYYGMYNLAIFTIVEIMNKWVRTNIVISSTIILLLLIFLWEISKIMKNLTNIQEVKDNRRRNIYDIIIAVIMAFLFFVFCGYLANRYLLPSFLTIKTTLFNIGIFVLSVGLILPSYFIIKKCSYELLNKMYTNLIHSKIAEIVSIATIVCIFGLNLYIYIYKNLNKQVGPNVLLIVVDTLRKDHLGCYGHTRNTSPNIDELAKRGIVFENCYSQSSWTLPSVATIMTSLYPSVHKSVGVKRKLGINYVTVTEVMKNNFYKTVGVISHVFVSSEYRFGQGFDVFDESCLLNEFSDVGKSSTSEYLGEKAIKYIRKNKNNRFFMYIHFFDPHFNYILHKEFNYFPEYEGQLGSNQDIRELLSLRPKMKSRDIDYLKSLYDSEISYTDKCIGQILNELERLDLYDNTMVILTADHGEEFMERNWIGHTRTLYGELINVPLIIKLVNSERGGFRTNRNVGVIDIFPTIIRACGIDLNGKIKTQGKDLLKAVREGKGDEKRDPIFSEVNFSDGGYNKEVEAFKKSIICERWKMIKNLEDNSIELYDLNNDQKEEDNVAMYNQDVVAKLNKQLRKWQEENLDFFAHKKREDRTDIRNDLKEKLKNLGYIN